MGWNLKLRSFFIIVMFFEKYLINRIKIRGEIGLLCFMFFFFLMYIIIEVNWEVGYFYVKYDLIDEFRWEVKVM